MKKLIYIVIFSCLINNIISTNVSAQCSAFTGATVTTIAIGPSSPTYTGSFAKTSTGGLPSMEVSVNESATFGFVWSSNLPSIGARALSANAKFPDVALLEGSCTLGNGYNWTYFAWVVYGIWNGTNYNAMYDIYEWDQSGGTQWVLFAGPSSIPNASGASQGTFDNVIRIDATGDQFAIIWDDLQTSSFQGVQAIAGSSSIGLSTAGSFVLVAGANNIYPDLSIFAGNPYSSPLPSIVWYTYSDLNNTNNLNVGQVYWNDLSSGLLASNNPAYVPLTPPCSTGVYAGRPRIACPDGISNSTNCPANEAWTVVSEYQSGCYPGTYDIVGYTYDCFTAALYGPNIYTDGSMTSSPCSTNVNQNTDPSVSYDYNNGYIAIGWDSWYAGGGASFIPTESIIAGCDITGNYLCTSYYLVVATIMGNGAARHLSISGRDYNNNALMYYSYYNIGGSLDFKDALTTFCNLRLGKISDDQTPEVLITPNPFVNEVTLTFADNFDHIKVFDMTGNLLLAASGNQDQINHALNELTFGLPQGVYMMRLDSENNSIFVNKKLIKM